MVHRKLLVLATLLSIASYANSYDPGKVRQVGNYCKLWVQGTPSNAELHKADKIAASELKENPSNWGALLCRIHVASNLKDWSGMANYSERLEKIAGNDSELWLAYNFVATAYGQIGSIEISREYFQKAETLAKRISARTGKPYPF